jgi:hypothetical protein
MFVRQQAIVFLTAVDDWLEARVEAPKQSAKSQNCAPPVSSHLRISIRQRRIADP